MELKKRNKKYIIKTSDKRCFNCNQLLMINSKTNLLWCTDNNCVNYHLMTKDTYGYK